MSKTIPEQFDLKSYSYELPDSAIAQEPPLKRGESKLLVLDRETGQAEFTIFSRLAEFLPDGALLIANNSRVVPARLFGTKETGGKVELLLLTPPPLITPEEKDDWQTAEATGLLRASKGPKPGSLVRFSDDFQLTVLEKGDFGRSRILLKWKGDLPEILEKLGHMPLPPYIHRPDSEEDKERYQTIYSNDSKKGSAAAPTAGLHFTPELHNRLKEKGFGWAEVTLYVGYGTFSPVREQDIREHEMHSEYIEISEETAEAVRKAKEEGRPIVAIGTTSVRTLEGAFQACGEIRPWAGWTDIYLRPGSTFHVVDHIVTNFHLPESSLLIMISAFAGRLQVLDTYNKALDHDFRFFSYGDAMFIK